MEIETSSEWNPYEKHELKIEQLESELTSLRAFKWACEEQEPIVYCCQGAINAFRHKHASVVGGFASGLIPLYTNPDQEAAKLRVRVQDLESKNKELSFRLSNQ